MSKHPPLIRSAKGFLIPGTEIHIDPLEPVPCAVISHAHGDHAVEGHETVYCSSGTAALLRSRFKYPAKQINVIPFHQPFVIGHTELHLTPAGHMLGSSQIVWKRDGLRFCYTGDYKREDDKSCEPYFATACDVLITEVTFGQTNKVHPPAEEIVASLSQFKDINLMIGAYNLGKSQRLTRLINDHAPQFRVMVHPNMVAYHHIYEQEGFPLGKWEPYKREQFKQQKSIVYLLPPTSLFNFRPGKHYLRGLATGWTEQGKRYDFPFPVSDHADWPSLIRTIRESGAHTVYTIHGDGAPLQQAPELKDIHILLLNE